MTGICAWQFPVWKGVKQNERDSCRCRHICGGHAVLMYPGRGAGGQMDGGNETERGTGCRQEGQTAGTGRGITGDMQQISRVTVSTVISGKGSGKDAARRNVITFSRKRCQCRKLYQKKRFGKNKMKTAPMAVKDVHTAGIPPASVTA